MTLTRSRTWQVVTALAVAMGFVALAGEGLSSQAPAGSNGNPPAPVALKGRLERVKVHGRSLEGNLLGESPAPEVSIYLPPSYNTQPNRRYPVVY
ncbi:MAG: esterase, partial [Gemmatimonadetes bacterium]|nr:esterase [Gemmatimonadota bacterium]